MENSVIFIAIMCLGLSTQKLAAQSSTKLDPSSQIEGIYNVTQMTIFSTGQRSKMVKLDKPGNKISAVITAKRKSQRYVILTFGQSQNGIPMLSFRYGDAYLRTTSKGYDLAIDGDKVGAIDGHTLTLDIAAKDKEGVVIKRSLLICKKS